MLTENFYRESLGADTFRRIMQIGNVLKEIADEQESSKTEYKCNPLNVADPEKVTAIYSSQIKMAVDYIFAKAEVGKIYSR